MTIGWKYLVPLVVGLWGCSSGSTTSNGGLENEASDGDNVEPIVEFRLSGETIQDTTRQRAYAACVLDGGGRFELLALAGQGAILALTVPSFELQRVEPFTEIDVSYSPGGDINPTAAFNSSTGSLCQLRSTLIDGGWIQGVFSCEMLNDAYGNSARLWEGEFVCTVDS